MIVTQELPINQLAEFNEITKSIQIRESYPRIHLIINRHTPETYLITVDDNNVGNAEDFLAEVFDRMEIE